jgi:hypothetical protein
LRHLHKAGRYLGGQVREYLRSAIFGEVADHRGRPLADVRQLCEVLDLLDRAS